MDDNPACLTRGSQPVINTGHYQPLKHPHVMLITNMSRETVRGIYEWSVHVLKPNSALLKCPPKYLKKARVMYFNKQF